MLPHLRQSFQIKYNILEDDLEENDDEAEKLARQEQHKEINNFTLLSGSRNKHQETLFELPVSHLSADEINNQISQCLKLNAENKINDKNAFQLQMIDFLVHSLKKQDPKVSNLQMASAYLDVSGKIYGFRVDKVHADLLKIIGSKKGEKRDLELESCQNENDYLLSKNNRRKKKKKNQSNISTIEDLEGNLETYYPLLLGNHDVGIQTFDILLQASFPQHVNQGTAINLCNDVILDKIPLNKCRSSNFLINPIDDFTNDHLCPSYATFKFLDWSSDNNSKESRSVTEDNSLYHFNLDDSIADENFSEKIMDYSDISEEKFDELCENNKQHENIIDFQDIILNNPNPSVTYEYSYLEKNHYVHHIGPSHWKIKFNKNVGVKKGTKSFNQTNKQKKKDIELSFAMKFKKEAKNKFVKKDIPIKLVPNTVKHWSEKKLINPLTTFYDLKRFYNYFHKSIEQEKNQDEKNLEEKCDSVVNDDHLSLNDDMEESELISSDNIIEPNTQEAFISNNLVTAPNVIDEIFIPYSQKAKKINIRQLNKTLWENLCAYGESNNNDTKSKKFSNIYLKLPEHLSKINAESLTPALAFVSLLHIANEKILRIENQYEFADVKIQSYKKRGDLSII